MGHSRETQQDILTILRLAEDLYQARIFDEVDFNESFKMFMTETTDRICFSSIPLKLNTKVALLRDKI